MNIGILRNILGFFSVRSSSDCRGCDDRGAETEGNHAKKVIIVGNPNVGKSLLFNTLTGIYVVVSNYPGTTVGISRGKMGIDGEQYEVIDTPGMYSFLPITEEERISRSLLLDEKPDVVLHVVDAKNLERMLPLTLQIIEAELPVVLDVNMIDEAESAGIEIDVEALGEELGIPVVATAAAIGRGIEGLRVAIKERAWE